MSLQYHKSNMKARSLLTQCTSAIHRWMERTGKAQYHVLC